MAKYTQDHRPIGVTTPLGKDRVLLEKFSGTEAISEPFLFALDLLAEEPIPFEGLLAQNVTVRLSRPGDQSRFIHGLVARLVQGARVPVGEGNLLRYRAEVRPKLWLLGRRQQSRIFQHLTVPKVLEQVLKQEWRLDVEFEIAGEYFPREYCVQYRETDLAFVSRLMEEEGIYYYFVHTSDKHTLIVSDQEQQRPAVSEPQAIVFGEKMRGTVTDYRVTSWEKAQEVCSHEFALRDYHFQLPDQNLEARHKLLDKVQAGTRTHTLSVGGPAELLEIYDHGGDYAHHHDGISKDGAEQSDKLGQIFQENARRARLRMEEEAASALTIRGESDCGHFLPGHTFGLSRHFDADGRYLLTRVEHQASVEGSYVSGESSDAALVYTNRFTCIPEDLPYRAPRATRAPRIEGALTAVVVGPAQEEIFCDKFGRVRVQFHWDRQGKHNADSSCWVRVSQSWAGHRYGMFTLPRVGQEVLVGFIEGDPDRPIIQGCVHNAMQMPPLELPRHQTQTMLKSRSRPHGHSGTASGLAIEDRLGHEHLQLHSERHMTQSAEGTMLQSVAGQQHTIVGGSSTRIVGYPLALKSTPAPGSGAGGGDEPTGGNGQGSSSISGFETFCSNANLEFGWSGDTVVGYASSLFLGMDLETRINPIAFLQLLSWAEAPEKPAEDRIAQEAESARLGRQKTQLEELNKAFGESWGKAFGGALTSAFAEVTIGSFHGLHYGLNYEISRGARVESAKNPKSRLPKGLAVLYGLVVTAVNVFLPICESLAVQGKQPLTSPDDAEPQSWGDEGKELGIGVAGGLILQLMLAIWTKFEMVESGVEIFRDGVNLEEELAKQIETQTVAELEARLDGAMQSQVKAMIRQGVGMMMAKAQRQASKEQLEAVDLSVKTFAGVLAVTAGSTLLKCTSSEQMAAVALNLEARRAKRGEPPEVDPTHQASVKISGDSGVFLSTEGEPCIDVSPGTVELPATGKVLVRSGREGSIALKMGEADPSHNLVLKKDGVRIYSRGGGIHIQHGASEAAQAVDTVISPRKVLIESGDSPVEIKGTRIILKAPMGIRLECGANIFELNETGMIAIKISDTGMVSSLQMTTSPLKLEEA